MKSKNAFCETEELAINHHFSPVRFSFQMIIDISLIFLQVEQNVIDQAAVVPQPLIAVNDFVAGSLKTE